VTTAFTEETTMSTLLAARPTTDVRTAGTLRAIVDASRAHEDAWRELLAEYREPLVRLATARLGRATDAEDVVHEVLLRVVRAGLHAEVAVGAYLRRAVLNECVTRWRRTHREIAVDQVPERETQADHAERTVIAMAVRQALTVLSDRHRSVVTMSFLDDLSDEEIAARLGISQVTVRTTRLRALRRLRLAMAEAGDTTRTAAATELPTAA
jgi:RNA polymerase sigma factor (sigma-70 family)